MKKPFFFILFFLVYCGKSNNSKMKFQRIVNAESGASLLGTGYDSHTETFHGQCVRAKNQEKGIVFAGQQKSEMHFNQSLTTDQLKNLLEVDVSGKLSYGIFNVSGASKFLSEAASSELSESLVFASITRGKYALISEPMLTDIALDSASTLDKNLIRKTCGDEFISKVELGSELLINVKFEFSSKEVKSEFDANIDLNFVGLFQVSGAAKVVSEKFSNNVIITISAYQVGGRVQSLPKIFKNSDNGSFGIINCNLNQQKSCQKAFQDIIEYATGDYLKQIDDMSYNPENPNSAAFLKYETQNYYEAGLRKLYPSSSPVLSEEIIEARTRIGILYEKNSLDRRRATKLLSMRLSDDEKRNIKEVDNILAFNIKQLVQAAKICYDTPDSCLEKENAVILMDYNFLYLNKELTFYDYCQIPRDSVFSNKTVEAIRKIFGSQKDTSCLEIETDLKNALVLDLSNQGISDLRPLRNLSQLKVLNLKDNRINNLEPLLTLVNLEELNLRNNLITNIKQLVQLKNLTILDLAYNQLVDVCDLNLLEHLSILKLFGPLNHIKNKNCFEKNKYEKIHLDLNTICEDERMWVFNNKMIPVELYKIYQQSNMTPLFNKPQQRESGISAWVYCDFTESFY